MIHQYQLNGFNIVLDVSSGAVHLLDKPAYDLLAFYSDGGEVPEVCPQEALSALPQHAPSLLTEAHRELLELFREGLLFSKDDYIDLEAFGLRYAPIKAMCLHAAHDCNLRCGYCFASTGDFKQGRCLLDLETGKRALDFLIRMSGKRRNLEVDFFGGEPLMNLGVVKKLVKYGREQEKLHGKNFRFTMTTNGVLLTDETIEYLNENMSNVVLSLDGRKEVNDRMRKRVDGSGCYDSLVPRMQAFHRRRDRGTYYVRGTFTRHNLDFASDVLHLSDLGFDSISVEPVSAGPDKDYALREEDLPAIFAEYERLAKEIIRRKQQGECFDFFHFMIDLEHGPCAIKRLSGCGCGNEYVAVTPEGDIYPCHQFVGMEEYRMGNVNEGSFDTEKKAGFSRVNIYSKEECRSCWARFFCSGGCTANNVQYAGGMYSPHRFSCELEKKRVECAIMIKAALARDEETEQAQPSGA